MTVVPAAERRTTTTPNATMTTCCTPEQGASTLALWLTAMAPGAQGPWHRLDGEQVLTVLAGAVTLDRSPTAPAAPSAVTVGGADSGVRLGVGDVAVIPADAWRRLTADPHDGVEMACAAPRPLRAHDGEGTDRGVPDWMR